MSHFTVLVVGDDVDAQLAPFDENTTTGPRREYLDKRRRVTMAAEYGIADSDDLAALAAHVEDWTGYDGGVDDHGLYILDTTNPDAKWDWYTVGGRRRGFFKLKHGRPGKLGPDLDHILGGEPAKNHVGRADIARKRDIDFDGMRDDAEAKARKTWATYASAIAGTPDARPFEDFEEQVAAKKLTEAAARKAYRAQPRVRAFDRAMRPILGPFISLESFPATEEDYVASKRRTAILPFAYVLDGAWYERGEMGWWGLASNEKPEATWAVEVGRMLESLPDETLLTIVDCHI